MNQSLDPTPQPGERARLIDRELLAEAVENVLRGSTRQATPRVEDFEGRRATSVVQLAASARTRPIRVRVRRSRAPPRVPGRPRSTPPASPTRSIPRTGLQLPRPPPERRGVQTLRWPPGRSPRQAPLLRQRLPSTPAKLRRPHAGARPLRRHHARPGEAVAGGQRWTSPEPPTTRTSMPAARGRRPEEMFERSWSTSGSSAIPTRGGARSTCSTRPETSLLDDGGGRQGHGTRQRKSLEQVRRTSSPTRAGPAYLAMAAHRRRGRQGRPQARGARPRRAGGRGVSAPLFPSEGGIQHHAISGRGGAVPGRVPYSCGNRRPQYFGGVDINAVGRRRRSNLDTHDLAEKKRPAIARRVSNQKGEPDQWNFLLSATGLYPNTRTRITQRTVVKIERLGSPESSQESAPHHRSELLRAALEYAEAGIPVFPCRAGEKKPLTRRGHLDATTSASKITAWWNGWPLANIGVPTGQRSGWRSPTYRYANATCRSSPSWTTASSPRRHSTRWDRGAGPGGDTETAGREAGGDFPSRYRRSGGARSGSAETCAGR